jgi:hypothetical protein
LKWQGARFNKVKALRGEGDMSEKATVKREVPLIQRPDKKTCLKILSTTNPQQQGKIRDGTTHHGSSCVRVFWHRLGTKT